MTAQVLLFTPRLEVAFRVTETGQITNVQLGQSFVPDEALYIAGCLTMRVRELEASGPGNAAAAIRMRRWLSELWDAFAQTTTKGTANATG